MKRFIIIVAILFAFSQPLTAETDPNNPALTEKQSHQAGSNTPSDHPALNAPGEQIITPELEARITQVVLESAETYYDNRFDSLHDTTFLMVTILLVAFTLIGVFVGVFMPYYLDRRRDKIFELMLDGQKQTFQQDLTKKEKELQKYTEKEIAEADEKLKEHYDKALENMQCSIAGTLGHTFNVISLTSSNANPSLICLLCELNGAAQYFIAKQYKNAETAFSVAARRIESIDTEATTDIYWSLIKSQMDDIESVSDFKDHPKINNMVDEIKQMVAYNLVLAKKAAEAPPKTKPEDTPSENTEQ